MNYKVLVPLFVSFSIFSVSIYQVSLNDLFSSDHPPQTENAVKSPEVMHPQEGSARDQRSGNSRDLVAMEHELIALRTAVEESKAKQETLVALQVEINGLRRALQDRQNEDRPSKGDAKQNRSVLNVTPGELGHRLKKYEQADARELFAKLYQGNLVTWDATFQALAKSDGDTCDGLFCDASGQGFWARFDKDYRTKLEQLRQGNSVTVKGKLDLWYGTTLYLSEGEF